ncbi:type II toxin-antitoxin system prevent-host-death family antitoxin [Leucobacter insecticola]|uniref:Antitoxin n=1 Tax=Leucobacter insecticola TaxID=2714934 RepID=A0A6G8FLC3_9MICO|nr:type II toxin-antitoxin system prevent-host-death family antitoxin [Leucobacter insecticola]QIM17089.1 type II toxin-antitoxin system prevent-host-death family antitoxin [Leucobacter insecticola]
MSTYSVFEARNSLSRLLAEARAGDEVVIANRGEPVAKLVSIDGGSDATGVSFAAWLEENPLPQRLGRPSEAIDVQILESRDAWE